MDGIPIKVVIASPHRLLREGLRAILHHDDSIDIVGEAVDGPQALTVSKQLSPSVLLMDISILEMNGTGTISAMRGQALETKVLVLSSSMEHEMIFKSLKVGIKGYVSKDANSEHLLKAIQAVHRGELWVQRKMIARFFDEEAGAYLTSFDESNSGQTDLTSREREVLSCLTSGCTNKEIAEKLFISEKTVKTHLNSIFRKLHVTKRLQAILYALERGMN
jgi:two-component system response regulator DegU